MPQGCQERLEKFTWLTMAATTVFRGFFEAYALSICQEEIFFVQDKIKFVLH